MTRLSILLLLAVSVHLATGMQARAEFIPSGYSYFWTPKTPVIYADNPTAGQIILNAEPGGVSINSSYMIATTITMATGADPSNGVAFTNRPYSLALNIHDYVYNKTVTLTFSGVLNGGWSSNGGFTITRPQKQSLYIGNDRYTVSLIGLDPEFGFFRAPEPGMPSVWGTATAFIEELRTPEPSSLVLSGLCLLLVGAGWLWKRARGLLLGLV
jgi:hypothetical protein